MRNYKTKKFATVGGKYVYVRVYKNLKALREAYIKRCEEGGHKHSKDVLGAHCAYTKVIIKPDDPIEYVTNETGVIYLTLSNTKSWIVAHEFLHALIHSHKHNLQEHQFPKCIDSIEQEEDIAYGLTDMLQKFYVWLPKIKF